MIGDNPNDAAEIENPLIGNPMPEAAGTGFREWEFFRTEAQTTDEGTIPYPEEGDEPAPDTYYARRLKNVKYDQEQGAPPLTYDLTSQFVFIKNMARSGNYLAENSIVIGFEKSGLWYTIDDQKGVANDYGMIAYTFGSYVVVLDDRDGSIVWGPTLITHERYAEHPTESYWEVYRGGWQTNSGADVEGMTYLRALKCRFDRRGNLFVAYDLIECKDTTDVDGLGSINIGGIVTSGMVRFDYQIDDRTFSKNWQRDVSKWFVAEGSRRLTIAMGWLTTSIYQTWAAFDVDDDGNIFYAAFGWQADTDAEDFVEDSEIITIDHFRERYNQNVCNTTLGATWLVRLDAATGAEVRRFKITESGNATLPAEQTTVAGSYCYPVWLGDVRTPGNGRVYLTGRAAAELGYTQIGRIRLDESGNARAYQNYLMQIDYDGNWRDRGGSFTGSIYNDAYRHDSIAYEWQQNAEGLYKLRAFVTGDFDGAALINPGPNDDCQLTCETDSSNARRLGRAGVLLVQSSGLSSAWVEAIADDELPVTICNYLFFNLCKWIRSGTDGFPIQSRTGFANQPTGSCDIHDDRVLIGLTSGFSYQDVQNNTRKSFNLWLSQALRYQPLPSAQQAGDFFANPVDGPSGFFMVPEGRFGNFVRYDTNDDSGANNGSAIWSFVVTSQQINAAADRNKLDRVYKVNQSGAFVWSALGDERNPSHELFASGGFPVQTVPVVGEGLGTSCDVYDPRENPDSPESQPAFVGRRFVPPSEDMAPPSPPDVL